VEQNNDHYVTKVQEMPSGELFVELPQKLIDQLDWEVGDDIEWGETRLAFMLTLSNHSKKFRDATEAFRDYDLEEPLQGSIAPKEELDRAANEEYNDEVEEE
jgi:hypothetical protein